MGLPVFVAGSFIGRGGRFFLVAALMAWGGAEMEGKLRTYIERLGWLVIVLAVVAFFYFRR